MKTPKGMYTDHINGNMFDNRKSNLRICTNAQNGMNQKISKSNTSGYKGVVWIKKAQKWQAQIKNGKIIYIGIFKIKEDAAKAYNQKAKELFGNFARLNIIKS